MLITGWGFSVDNLTRNTSAPNVAVYFSALRDARKANGVNKFAMILFIKMLPSHWF